MIKAVLFDYGGVLSPGGKNFRADLGKVFNIDPEDLKTDKIRPGLWSGQMDSTEFFAELSRLHGKQITAEQFFKASGILERDQKVYHLAATLREHGIKTGIFSNMYKSSADLIREDGNYDHFDPIVLSFEANMFKPDAEFYKLAVARTGVSADEVLFIDDQDRFLEPARALGIKTILAKDPDQIVTDTKALVSKENGLEL